MDARIILLFLVNIILNVFFPVLIIVSIGIAIFLYRKHRRLWLPYLGFLGTEFIVSTILGIGFHIVPGT